MVSPLHNKIGKTGNSPKEKIVHTGDQSTFQKYANNTTNTPALYHCIVAVHTTTALK